jgi:HAD superfamily hydrolase (TIGR01450 family)
MAPVTRSSIPVGGPVGGPLSTPPDLQRALAGVRALVLDADGVVYTRGAALPGAADALAALDARGIPYRIATNISSMHRDTLAAWFGRMGLPLAPERIVTALSATADHVRRAHPGEPVFVITRPDGLREFDGHPLLTPAEAGAADARAAAVVLGDGETDLSYENLDRAFRLLRRGARLIAMHHNPWWLTARGETLDTGAFVAALEYATGTRALLVGKPAPLMFRAAHASLAAEVAARGGGPRLRLNDVAMIGDHARQDIGGAQRAGLRGILVLSGRTPAAEVPGLRGRSVPAAVAATLGDVVAALG